MDDLGEGGDERREEWVAADVFRLDFFFELGHVVLLEGRAQTLDAFDVVVVRVDLGLDVGEWVDLLFGEHACEGGVF